MSLVMEAMGAATSELREYRTDESLGSMMSTARANLSVGPPYDLAIYRNDAFRTDEFRIEADSRILAELEATWERRLRESFAELPSFEPEGLSA